jgi:predicted MFS family arabinose efflux permease
LIVAACGEARRTWALSRYSMTAALAGIVGPLAGGASMQLAGWAGVFWFRLPVALLALLSLALLPKPPAAPSSHSGLGVLSSVLLATGLAALLFSAALLPDTAYPAWPVAGGAAGLYLLFLFARRERGSAQRVLPSAALHDPSLRLSNLTSIMVHLVGFAIPLLVPYYLVRIGGFDASAIGVLLALATVGVLIASIFAPRTIRAIGQYRCAQLGVAFVALAQLLMACWPPAPSMMELIPALMLHGAGIGLFQVGYADHVVASLHARDRGVAGSLTVLTRTLGVITGAVVLSSALQALETRQVAAGLTAHDAFYAAFRTIFVTSGLLLAGFTVWVAMRQK